MYRYHYIYRYHYPPTECHDILDNNSAYSRHATRLGPFILSAATRPVDPRGRRAELGQNCVLSYFAKLALAQHFKAGQRPVLRHVSLTQNTIWLH